MTIDDNDDAVVPSGSRRSSYVPPPEENSGDAIDIPRIVVSGDIPEAYSSSDSVPGLQRPVSDDVATGEIPLPILEPAEPALSIPARQSLTPEELSRALDPSAGLSSTDQMALLDSQIALREADAKAANQFLEDARSAGTAEAAAMFDTAKSQFADVAPELVSVRITPAVPIPSEPVSVDEPPAADEFPAQIVAEEDPAAAIAPAVVDAEPEFTLSGIEFIENIVSSESEDVSKSSDWSLEAPATTTSATVSAVKRLHLTTVSSVIAVTLTTLMLAFSAGLEPKSLIGIAGASLVLASVLVFGARSLTARRGSTLRETVESLTGTIVGRTLLVVAAVGAIGVVTASTAALMHGVAESEVTAGFVSRMADIVGPVPPIATMVVLGLAVVLSALPLRALRAFLLTGIGFSVTATGSVLGMSGFLVAASEKWEIPDVASIAASGGYVMSLALAIVGVSFAAIHSLTREHNGIRNGIWLSVGAGIGFLVAAGTIALALISPESEHYFFANNSLVHVVSSSATLAVILGGLVSGVAIVTTATLVVRGALVFTVTDDRSEPSVWWKVAAVAAVGLMGALLFVGVDESGALVLGPDVVDLLIPPAGLSVLGIAVVLGLALAHSIRPNYRSTRARRVMLAFIALVMTTLALGFSTGTGSVWGWLGFINGPLTELGFGVLYVDALAAPLVMLATAALSLFAMIQRRERAIDSPVQD